MTSRGFHHVPVLLEEAVAALSPIPGGDYLDGTAGGGGHSEAIARILSGQGTLTLMDRDAEALKASRERLSSFQNISYVHGNFHDARQLLDGRLFDGILLDLGVSSPQLDNPERGFSYHEDAPLDMRMDTSRGVTAADWLNITSEREMTQALYDFADERWAARIAKTIAEMRKTKPFETTFDLVEAVDRAIPRAVRRKDEGHPARRAFQAVRIAVNGEIAPLPTALEDLAGMLKPGGRLCVISFHSIEDRAVKHTFRKLQNPCSCPPDAPLCVCGKKPVVSLPKGYPKAPTDEELSNNPRSRSALLRVAEKLP